MPRAVAAAASSLLDPTVHEEAAVTTPDLIPAPQPHPAVRLYRWFITDYYALAGLVMVAFGSTLIAAAILTWGA